MTVRNVDLNEYIYPPENAEDDRLYMLELTSFGVRTLGDHGRGRNRVYHSVKEYRVTEPDKVTPERLLCFMLEKGMGSMVNLDAVAQDPRVEEWCAAMRSMPPVPPPAEKQTKQPVKSAPPKKPAPSAVPAGENGSSAVPWYENKKIGKIMAAVFCVMLVISILLKDLVSETAGKVVFGLTMFLTFGGLAVLPVCALISRNKK